MFTAILNGKELKKILLGSTCDILGDQVFIDNYWYKLPDSNRLYLEDDGGFRYKRIFDKKCLPPSKLFIFQKI